MVTAYSASRARENLTTVQLKTSITWSKKIKQLAEIGEQIKMKIEKELDLKNNVVAVDGTKYLLSTVSFEWAGSFARQICGYDYETMLFGYNGNEVDYRDLYCERYSDKDEAEKRHNELLQLLKSGEKFWQEEE